MGGMIRPWAEFGSDLPEDHIEDEGEIVQYGGKSVAEAIHKILGGLGCELEEVTYAHEHGWEFNFRYRKRRLWCRVTLIDKYLAVVEERSLMSKLFGDHPAYAEILAKLATEMAQDGRFEDVLWYAGHEVHGDKPGAKSPVAA